MKTWEITRTLYKVSDFISWQRSGSLLLSPKFQRRPVWQPGARSYFIDTLVRGLPVPIIFLRDLPSGVRSLEPLREVVDGQQRLRTVLSYVAPELLQDHQPSDVFRVMKTHNPEIGGLAFRELPHEYQTQILDYQFTVNVFPAHTDDREILQIFARMNSTGVRLNYQELRNASFFGRFKTAMYELAAEQFDRWRRWGVFNDYEIARMHEVELTSEFAILMLSGIHARGKRLIDSAYEQRDVDFSEEKPIRTRFRAVMDTIDEDVSDLLSATMTRKKTLFYALFAAFYEKGYGLGSQLRAVKMKSISREWIDAVHGAVERIQADQAPQRVMESIQRRTTDAKSRRTLVNYLTTL